MMIKDSDIKCPGVHYLQREQKAIKENEGAIVGIQDKVQREFRRIEKELIMVLSKIGSWGKGKGGWLGSEMKSRTW